MEFEKLADALRLLQSPVLHFNQHWSSKPDLNHAAKFTNNKIVSRPESFIIIIVIIIITIIINL